MPAKKCPVCNGVGVVEVEVRRLGTVGKEMSPCPAPNCLAGSLARIFRKSQNR